MTGVACISSIDEKSDAWLAEKLGALIDNAKAGPVKVFTRNGSHHAAQQILDAYHKGMIIEIFSWSSSYDSRWPESIVRIMKGDQVMPFQSMIITESGHCLYHSAGELISVENNEALLSKLRAIADALMSDVAG